MLIMGHVLFRHFPLYRVTLLTNVFTLNLSLFIFIRHCNTSLCLDKKWKFALMFIVQYIVNLFKYVKIGFRHFLCGSVFAVFLHFYHCFPFITWLVPLTTIYCPVKPQALSRYLETFALDVDIWVLTQVSCVRLVFKIQ